MADESSSWQQEGSYRIFDSCTTLFYLPQRVYDMLSVAINQSSIWTKAGVPNFLVSMLLKGYGLYDVSIIGVFLSF